MIITRLQGGMGNQMFQYAFGRALALRNKVSLGLDISFLLDRTPRLKGITFRNYMLDVFNIQGRVVAQSEIPVQYRVSKGFFGIYINYIIRKFLKPKGVEKSTAFDSSIFDLGANAYLNGFWQSEKYFKNIEDIIRADFSLKIPLSDTVRTIAEKIQCCDAVSIHVRRGDYVTTKNGRDVLGACSLEYYVEAISLIRKKVPNPTFFVFSDDIEWCREHIVTGDNTTFISGQDYEDLTLMSMCKHNIIANSTFSWWGAWLNSNKNKMVIAPQKWYNDLSYSSENLIPEDWIHL